MNSTVVLYFTDGPEAEASLHSALSIKGILGDDATLLPLTNRGWMAKLDAIAPNTLCFLATHGGIGEDGTLQSYLESRSIRHTHSSAATSGLLTDKHLAKLTYLGLSIPTPPWVFAGKQYGIGNVTHPLKKARWGGSKQGITAVRKITNNSQNIYEEIILGEMEVVIGVIRDGNKHHPLTPIVRRRQKGWGNLQDVPSETVSMLLRSQCQRYAVAISEALDCYGVTKTDFLIDEKENIWAIETDAIPGLSQANAVSRAAGQAGITYKDLLNKIKENPYGTR